MLSKVFAAVTNHLLEPASWATRDLAPHQGKVARLECLHLTLTVQVDGDGHLRAAPEAEAPDARIRLTPDILGEFLTDRNSTWRKVQAEGDTDFLQAIAKVATHLRWDIEEDLSRLTGDIAAHRIVRVGRSLAGWPGEAGANLAAGTAEYLTEEIHLLVTPLEAQRFVEEVDALRDAVERLDKRIGLLEQPTHRS